MENLIQFFFQNFNIQSRLEITEPERKYSNPTRST